VHFDAVINRQKTRTAGHYRSLETRILRFNRQMKLTKMFMVRPGGAPSPPEYASGTIIGYMHALLCIKNKHKQVYRRRYESRRSSKPKLHLKKIKINYGEKPFSIWRMELLHPAMCQVAMGWHMEFAQTFTILEFYIWFRVWPHHRSRHVILHQSVKFYPNRTTLSRKKWRHADFQDGGSQPSWILWVQQWVLWKAHVSK